MTIDITQNVEILLVEDNSEDAELCIRSLKKNNLANDIKWVDDGQEALDFLQAKGDYDGRDILNIPKLILLDLKLPKVNGLEVLKVIKESSNIKHIPVVMLTSSKEEQDIVKSYNLGVNSYIVKPVEFNKFSNAIKEVGLYWMVINNSV